MSKDDGLILTINGVTGYFPKEFIIEAIETHIKIKQSEFAPCDVCLFNPPSSIGGKPCTVCPAQKKVGE